MATKVAPDDTEDTTLGLRKKPVRRATAKATKQQPSTSSVSASSKPAASKEESSYPSRSSSRAAPEPATTTKTATTTRNTRKTQQPLSPKKITQVAKAKPATRNEDEAKKPVPVASAKPRRPLRAASTKSSDKEVAPAKSTAKAPATRGRPRKVAVKEVNEEKTESGKAGIVEEQPAEEHQEEHVGEDEGQADARPDQDQVEKDAAEDEDVYDAETIHVCSQQVDPTPHTKSQSQPAPKSLRKTRNKAAIHEQHDPPATIPSPEAAAANEFTVPNRNRIDAVPLDESEDEICGPKTPMRRGWSPAKPSAATTFGTAVRPLQTPARRLLLDPHRATPYTQKVPIRAPAAASPQRPMTLARGISKPMIFRPLPRPDDANNAPEPSPSKMSNVAEVNHNPSLAEPCVIEPDTEHTSQESEAVSVDQADSTQSATISPESDSEDELHGAGHLLDDEDDELLLDAPNDNIKEADYEDDTPHMSEEEADDTDLELDHDDHTLIQPQLQTDLLNSSPIPTAPSVSCQPNEDVDMSDVASSPAPSTPGSVTVYSIDNDSSPEPSTPGSVIVHDVAEAETPTQTDPVPVSRLSFAAETSVPDLTDHDFQTPAISSRMSFNTANARMLQTPHMRAFRESNVNLTPTMSEIPSQSEVTANANCIDPSLLLNADDAFDLAQEADSLAGIMPERTSPSLAAQAETMEPASAFSGRRSVRMEHTDSPRLSLLIDSLVIQPADYAASPSKSLGSSLTRHDVPDQEAIPKDTEITTVETEVNYSESSVSKFMQDEDDMDKLAGPVSDHIDVTVRDFAVTSVPAEEAASSIGHDDHPKTPTVPRYARPTVASETRSRRKTISSFAPATPKSVCKRPVTAETTIKPITSEAFAKLWAAKQAQSIGHRRSSLRRSTQGHEVLNSTPMSSETRTPDTGRSGLRPRMARTSSIAPTPQVCIEEQPATPEVGFSGARPRKHTPSARKSRPKTPKPPPRTPIKTPLKAPGATPAPFPMTPHPSQPLSSVTALVEIYTLDGSSASGPFIALLQRLGARTTKVWSDRVTHVVFKDGSPATLQKVRLANKDGDSPGASKHVFCVNSRWVSDCDKEGKRMDEDGEEYAVDVDDIGTKSKAAGRHRRRKSMEPASLKNVDGNVVATDSAGSSKPRRPSVSRKSMARASLASTFWGTPGMSPVKGGIAATSQQWEQTPPNDQENQGDESFWDNSEVGTPVLPGYMNRQQELEMLQRTAPVNRMKKLRLRDADDGRRLTFFDGRD